MCICNMSMSIENIPNIGTQFHLMKMLACIGIFACGIQQLKYYWFGRTVMNHDSWWSWRRNGIHRIDHCRLIKDLMINPTSKWKTVSTKVLNWRAIEMCRSPPTSSVVFAYAIDASALLIVPIIWNHKSQHFLLVWFIRYLYVNSAFDGTSNQLPSLCVAIATAAVSTNNVDIRSATSQHRQMHEYEYVFLLLFLLLLFSFAASSSVTGVADTLFLIHPCLRLCYQQRRDTNFSLRLRLTRIATTFASEEFRQQSSDRKRNAIVNIEESLEME